VPNYLSHYLLIILHKQERIFLQGRVCRPCVRAQRFRRTLDECLPFTKNGTSVFDIRKDFEGLKQTINPRT
jgi:hypothetical protein